MRKFMGQVAIVASLTLIVSVALALTTASTGPGDESRPAAANESESAASTSESSDEAPSEEALTTAQTPAHLDENEDAGDTTTAVLGAIVAQESGSELADTGLQAMPILLIASALLLLGIGSQQVSRRIAADSIDS